MKNLFKQILGIESRYKPPASSPEEFGKSVVAALFARKSAQDQAQPGNIATQSDAPGDSETGQAKLRLLYEQNWRAMRDVEFERYLRTVFLTQGYHAEATASTGDQGVDLIVSKSGVRIAIQVKGYHHSVGNAAVQQAFAGMTHYRCDNCAVITNSRFTNGAVRLAKSTKCLLIDESNFQAFVMGNIAFTHD